MWSLLPKLTFAVGRTFTKVATKFASKKGLGSAVNHSMSAHGVNAMIKMHVGMSAATLAFGQGPPGERFKQVATSTFWMWATLGMNSPWRQAIWGIGGAIIAPHAGQIVRGMVGSYRAGLNAQTSAAIPFSHSNLNMNQAYATLSYARQRMSETYGHLGNEASFLAASLLRR